AFRNEVFVSNGNIIGAATHSGIFAGITYIEAFASEAAYKIEQAVRDGRDDLEVRVRIARSPSDLNIRVDPVALRYITSHHKKIDVRGPVFTTVRMKATKA
ncbi:MAG: O-phosphoserine--tRNA ligase, partial [Halobacteriota archaeon]